MRKSRLIIITILIIIIAGIICVSCVTHADKIEYYVGNTLYATDTIAAKSRYALPKVPTRKGYIFAGWYYDKGEWHRPFDYTDILPDKNNSIRVYAKFIRGEFEAVAITLEPNNGSPRTQYLVTQDTMDLPKVEKNGYLFIGWYQDKALTVPFLYNRKLRPNEILYAKWEYSKAVTVVAYDSNGGSAIPTQVVALGAKIDEPTPPTRQDYSFDGWYADSDYKYKWDFALDTVESGVTLYAKWKLQNIYVRFEVSSEDTSLEYKIAVGERAPSVTLPNKTGKEFAGWYLDRQFTKLFDISSALTQDTTLYAKWIDIVVGYDVEYVSADVVIAKGKTQSGCVIEDRIPDPSRENQVFAGWYKDTEFAKKWNFREDTVKSATRLYAKYLAPTINMSYELQADNTYALVGMGGAFAEQNVVIPEKYNGKYVTRIAANVFANQNINSLFVCNSVKYIASGALSNAFYLHKIEIGRGAQEIAEDFCVGADAINEISVDSGNERYLSLDNALYTSDMKRLVKYATASLNEKYVAPNGVEIISDYAFAKSELIEVVLPNTLKVIGARAFSYSPRLQAVTFGLGVETIGEKAFIGCDRLERAILPTVMRGIGASAFSNCRGLRELKLPNECAYINAYAFENCVALASVYVPSSIAVVNEYAFANLNAKLFVNAKKTPPLWAANWTNVIDTNIVARNTHLSQDGNWLYSEEGDTAYINGYLSKSVNVEVPYEVDGKRVVGFGNIFASNNTLRKVTIDGRIGVISSAAFYNCSNLVEVLINSGIATIGDRAFFGCSSLSDIYLPRSVKNVGEYAFGNCVSLQNVTLSDGMQSVPTAMFTGCTSLNNVYMPSGILEIGESAYLGCINLTTILWKDKITKIGKSAFAQCQKLRDVKIPNSVTEIGENAFYDCVELSSVTLPSDLRTLNARVFYNCAKLASVNFTSMNNLLAIKASAFENCSALESLQLPNSLVSIGERAFKGASALKEIALPNALQWIGNSAFAKCVSLTHIVLPTAFDCVGDQAFSDCSSLQYVVIPSAVQEIFASAFAGCAKVTFFIDGNGVNAWSVGWNSSRPYYIRGEWHYENGLPIIGR